MSARLVSLTVAACLYATAVLAADAPTRIRGTIAGLEGQTLSINTREGPKIEVRLNDPLTVATVKRFDLADIKPGTYVGIATRTGAVEATSGRELSLSFKGESNKIVVPSGTPIVTFAPAERADLTPGAPIFLIAPKNAEGKLAVSRVTVGKDGVAPPM